MKIASFDNPAYVDIIASLGRRYQPEADVKQSVTYIIDMVRRNGDKALVELARQYDHVELDITSLSVAAHDWSHDAEMDPSLLAAHNNVHDFAIRGMRQDWQMTNEQGVQTGERFQPFNRVGIYVPGGGASLVSTVIMTAALAQAAGCPEIVVCTPCGRDGKLDPAMLAALRLCGVTEVYRIGGAQAIAAMAYGTATIRPVDKIFGPGNKYVVEAKRQVFGTVAIDLLPGPSEIMVLCDESANPAFVAADLIAQAEHGHGGEMVLVTTEARMIEAVQKEIEIQSALLSRADTIRNALDEGAWLVEVAGLEGAIALCNDYAPEHLSLVVKDEAGVLPKIKTAGAIFLGNYSPVAAGDFIAGPSHTLPTGGAGKSFSGLTVDQFQRRTSIVKLDRESLAKTAPHIVRFGQMEGLHGHARTATIRLEPSETQS